MSDTAHIDHEPTGSSPGGILKRCREYHDISLDDAAEATKIGVSYLTALEADQITEFANLAYLKGFLRIYATYLGLNPDDMARMYNKLYGIKDDDSPASRKESTTPAQRRITLRKLALPLGLLALILITSFFIRRSQQHSVRQAVATPPTVQSAAILPARSSVPVKLDHQETEKATRPAATAPTPAEQPSPARTASEQGKGSFILKLRVTQNGTLSASIDDATAQQYDLTAGDIIEWKAEKSVTLELGNAGGVEAEINGKPTRPLGPTGKPAFVVIDSEGVKQ